MRLPRWLKQARNDEDEKKIIDRITMTKKRNIGRVAMTGKRKTYQGAIRYYILNLTFISSRQEFSSYHKKNPFLSLRETK